MRFGGFDQGVGPLLLSPLLNILEKFFLRRREIVGLLEKMPKRNIRQMDGHHGIGVTSRELFRDCASPISAMSSKL